MSVSKKDYKHTVHLPQTSFSMKASLPESEPKRLKLWEEGNLYARIQKKWTGARQKFILHDGPPYANGNIHIGHALNKILKDIIVKYKTMRGFNALYVPGWDCHGLPIEHQCLKEMGKRKDQVERVAFRKQARQYAERFVDIQRKEFKRLGIFGEWDKPYLTMDYSYQATIAESFISLYEKGFIEQRLKPVPWCWDCETALADAELEYEDKTDKSIYVAFEIDSAADENKKFLDFIFKKTGKTSKVSVLIWTTTPWTLPANVAVAYNPKIHYQVIEFYDGNVYVIALDRLGIFETKNEKQSYKDITSFEGKTPFTILKHPFLPRTSKLIVADYVSASDGTGFVHIAPGHGEEDYRYGHLGNKLPIISPVDEKGRFTKEFPPCEGVNVFKANEKIVEILEEKKALLHVEDYPHSYPHCWRCKKPIVFRATPQWFLKIDHDGLRKQMQEAIQKKIQFTPDWGKNRIGSMVESRPDWCLSRQRYWGVPIPIVRCAKCPNMFFVKELKAKLTKIFEAESADAWFSRSAADFLPDGFKCPKCGSHEFKKEEDIVDVWFDSGVSHQAMLKKSKTLGYPADLYLEGSDQHRGWFQSALTTGIALDRESPFKGVLTHGFVVDGEGKKMSKSAGNVVRPQDVMKEFGADILRLWVSSCDYQFDVRLSKEILKQLADQYRKVRNTFRYMLSNLFDFDSRKDRIPLEKLHPLDQWAVTKADLLIQNVIKEYDTYDFHAVFQQLHGFCSLDLSSYYFDVLKDTLYTARKDSFLRRSAQSGLFEILSRLVKVFAPILVFTMDEVWQSFPIEEGVTSVHEAGLEVLEKPFASASFNEWDKIRMVRDAIMPSLEKKRSEGLIRSSLDAKIYISAADPETQKVLRLNLNELRRVFIVSQVYWLDGSREGIEEVEGSLTIAVKKADGKKCDRCWNYSVEVGNFLEHPTLCERCVEAIYPTTCF